MNETKALATFAADTQFDTLPERVVAKIKSCVLDYLGAAVYCSQNESSISIKNYAGELGWPGNCTVINESWRTSAPLASMINATMGHGFELDDFHGRAFIHPGTVIIPAALAVAEETGADGRRLITAMAAAYETMIRLGMALTVSHNFRGFHPTGTTGPFAAGVAAAKLMGFDRQGIVNTLGVAGSMSSGIKEFYLDGNMVKRLHGGRAAEGGLTAAKVVAAGFDGPKTVLEGKFGFFHAFTDDARFELLTKGLGVDWEIMNVNVKPYACCGGIHSAISGMLDLKSQGLRPEEVEEVFVETCEKVAVQNSGPGTSSVMAAQYSIPFTLALTLLQDIEDPSIYRDSILNDSAVVGLSEKMRVAGTFKDAGMEKARVTVKTKEGRSLIAQVEAPKGHPDNPLRHEDVVKKFRLLAAGHWSDERIERIVATVGRLENLEDIAELSGLLTD